MCNSCEIKMVAALKDVQINEYFQSNNYKRKKVKESKGIQTGVLIQLKEKDVECSFSSYSNQKSSHFNYTEHYEKFHENFKLKPFKEICPKLNKKLKEGMLQCMMIKGYKFCDDLIYPSHEIEIMNQGDKEPGLFPTSEHNKNIYNSEKKKTREGNYAGLEIIYNELQGFVVQAVVDIPCSTFLCEYAGEVNPQRKVFFDNDNDSIMELLKAPSSVDCLVIKPEKYTNIARFISGINNFRTDSYKKINVNSVKMNVDSKAHIILYAARNIKAGEILYYDYNRGGCDYPTENFI